MFEPPQNFDPLWIGVGSVIKVERSGTCAQKPYQSISYYLCSLVFVAEEQKSEAGEAILIAKQKPVVLGDIQGQSYDHQS